MADRVAKSMSAGPAGRLVFVVGCTGCGKGAVGLELARRLGAEIVSLDSMKVYRRMDIGTAKPSADARREIPHHVIDIVEPWEDFSVARYVQHAEQAIAEIGARRTPILIVGGTPLYLKALTEGLFEGPGADPVIRSKLREEAATRGPGTLHSRLQRVDPVAASRIHPNDLRRVVRALEVFELTGEPISKLQQQWDRGRSRRESVLIGLRRELTDQNHRTNMRVGRMIEAGLVDEVKSLLAEARPLSTPARQALGYAEIIQHLEGKSSLAEAVEMIKINTRQFAKAQRTWFRRFREAIWIDVAPDATAARIVDKLVQRFGPTWSESPS